MAENRDKEADISALFAPVYERIHSLLGQRPRGRPETGRPFFIAIDGMSGSGKTRLAGWLARKFELSLCAMDDFFLPPPRKTPERLAQPGGNVDYERLLREVLTPLLDGQPAQYRRYDCHRDGYDAPVLIPPHWPVLVEGVYSMHPAFGGVYDLAVFLTVDPEVQERRIRTRSGHVLLERYRREWIPLENAYFSATGLPGRADLTIDTTAL